MKRMPHSSTIALLFVAALLVGQVSDKILAARSSQSSQLQEQRSAGAIPAGPKWEYRVLVYPPTYKVHGRSYDERALEQEVNQLAEQGYVVESFQPSVSISGGSTPSAGFSLGSESKIIVLLKREKK